jgi:hypothetical protein
MNRYYFTFGQAHAHRVGGFTYDKDVVCVINAYTSAEARKLAFEAFGELWAFEYVAEPEMRFFPRGLKELNPKI